MGYKPLLIARGSMQPEPQQCSKCGKRTHHVYPEVFIPAWGYTRVACKLCGHPSFIRRNPHPSA